MAREAKKVNELAVESVQKRIELLQERFKYWYEHIDEAIDTFHIQPGNEKTGKSVWTVSLMPILDCVNCSGCSRLCYDIRNDCIYSGVINDRARNSAIHRYDSKLYFELIGKEIEKNKVKELRFNVGGDFDYCDFEYIAELANSHKDTMFLFFTKNYNGLNRYIDTNGNLPSNVKKLLSGWKGMEMNNPHNLPCSHVLLADGTTTAPQGKLWYACGGNCSECAMHYKEGNKLESGCWGLTNGEHVVFPAH